MGRIGKILVGGLVAVSGPAWAGESLINGQPLQYNVEYHCNNERLIVGHCYDNDDNSYCQSYYPDRPKYNGFEIMKAEKRGDIVARLNACYRPPTSAEIAAGTARLKAALSAPTATAPAVTTPTITPPGVGDAKWSMLHMADEFAIYFSTAGIKRSGGIGSGWFTAVNLEPQNDEANNLSGVEFVQEYNQADCSKRLLKVPALAVYDDKGKLLTSGPDTSAKWEKVESGTIGEKEFNILCGRPQALETKTPIAGDHETIQSYYLQQAMKQSTDAMEKEHERLMNGGTKPH